MFSKYVLFKRRAPKQKGGCLDTLDTPWIRHCCLSVCLCLLQVGDLSKRMDGLRWFLVWRLLSTCPTLCYKEIQVSTKIKVLPAENLS